MHAGQIFIVDDNAHNLALLSGILQDAGYEVRAANSGRRALQMAERQPPELILLDISMPEIDGYEVCRRLKQDPALAPIPVIFVSALDDVFDKVKAFEAGGVDYVPKPFQAAEVLARVSAQLRLARLQRELERKNEELVRTNEELRLSQRKTEQVFAALSDVLPGTVLAGSYRIEEKIGEGGFGAVFRARHLELDRLVAIKVLRPTSAGLSPEGLARFRLEGITACRLDHPNAVEVLDFGVSSSGIAYLVMELLTGRTLEQALDGSGPQPISRCAAVLAPVCDVLAEAHRMGIVHRDIKPENIFLHVGKHGAVVKVVDFGLAKLFEDAPGTQRKELTVDGTILGTPTYMAPERVVGDPYGGAADVYSVGVVMYRMLCGTLPFGPAGTSNPYMSALMHVTRLPKRPSDVNPEVAPELEALVLDTLAKDPSVRPSAAALARSLRDFADRDGDRLRAMVPGA
jgi:CheY-like chemotaxis protein